jgi:hypothetical protein
MFKKRKTSSATYRNFTVPERYISKFNYDNMLKTLEFRETKDKSIHFRRNLLEKQKVNNYIGEIERIRGDLSQTVLNHQTRDRLIERKTELKAMSAKAIAGMHKR